MSALQDEAGIDRADLAGAVAIFVKTPGRSVVKSRLAAEVGVERAVAWYRQAASAVASVARQAKEHFGISAYWAVAEADALEDWPGLPVIAQGEGGLGERMARVHAMLVRRHGHAILLGADAPQLTAAMLGAAHEWLSTCPSTPASIPASSPASTPATRLSLGPASDGGFWLFGSNVIAPLPAWTRVGYSAADTGAQFRQSMQDLGEWQLLPTLTDLDHASDNAVVLRALQALPTPTPEQQLLAAWMQENTLHIAGDPA